MPSAAAQMLAALIVTGCAVAPASPPPAPTLGHDSTCNAEPAFGLIGRADTPESRRQALELSGSEMLRVLRPGDGATADYQTGRVNLILDDQGRIAEIRCG
jgi:hypothetical protein